MLRRQLQPMSEPQPEMSRNDAYIFIRWLFNYDHESPLLSSELLFVKYDSISSLLVFVLLLGRLCGGSLIVRYQVRVSTFLPIIFQLDTCFIRRIIPILKSTFTFYFHSRRSKLHRSCHFPFYIYLNRFGFLLLPLILHSHSPLLSLPAVNLFILELIALSFLWRVKQRCSIGMNARNGSV